MINDDSHPPDDAQDEPTNDASRDVIENIQDADIPGADTEQGAEAEAAPKPAAKLPPRELHEDETQDLLRLLEALLFTASDVVTLNDLTPFFPPQTPVEQLLERLETQYAERGINLVQRGHGWALRTAPDLGERLQIRKVESKPMSRPVIETLAIIAYHQPVTKPEIEQIRGVSVGKNIMETLLEQNLIKPGKRREVPGRPLTWVTNPHFLDAFGLTSLKDLPNLQEMKEQGLLTVTPPNFNLQPHLGSEDDADDADETLEDDNSAGEEADIPDDTTGANKTLSPGDATGYADDADEPQDAA